MSGFWEVKSRDGERNRGGQEGGRGKGEPVNAAFTDQRVTKKDTRMK